MYPMQFHSFARTVHSVHSNLPNHLWVFEMIFHLNIDSIGIELGLENWMIEREGDRQYENAVCYEKYNATTTTTTNNINTMKKEHQKNANRLGITQLCIHIFTLIKWKVVLNLSSTSVYSLSMAIGRCCSSPRFVFAKKTVWMQVMDSLILRRIFF